MNNKMRNRIIDILIAIIGFCLGVVIGILMFDLFH